MIFSTFWTISCSLIFSCWLVCSSHLHRSTCSPFLSALLFVLLLPLAEFSFVSPNRLRQQVLLSRLHVLLIYCCLFHLFDVHFHVFYYATGFQCLHRLFLCVFYLFFCHSLQFVWDSVLQHLF
uniref:Uncharacterized protein n=1 Tax=Cacopsylla melanoneura TaxID=428564 RepID=A0A8D8UJ80_9HEMI